MGESGFSSKKVGRIWEPVFQGVGARKILLKTCVKNVQIYLLKPPISSQEKRIFLK
jgi:hypothetical protein